MKIFRFLPGIALVASSSALAADLLPLMRGIYVPASAACKGASNAEIVNYWGGDSGIGVAQAECKIKQVTRKANVYTLTGECRDIQGGDLIEVGPTDLTIINSTAFEMSGTAYRYCGAKAQF
jgi:hypothetical protein